MPVWVWVIIAIAVVLFLLLLFRPARTVTGRRTVVRRPRRTWRRRAM